MSDPLAATATTGGASTSSAEHRQSGNDKGDHADVGRRHNLTPSQQQALKLERLLANVDKPVAIPSAPQEKTLRPPRETMKNVSGSSAGAGSGEFHIYKQSRRREYERVKLMEASEAKRREQQAFEERQKTLQDEAAAKTSKNRAKRDKKKAAREAARAATGKADVGPTAPADDAKETDTGTGKRAAEDVDETQGEGKRTRINADGVASVTFNPRDQDDAEEE